MKSRVRRLFPCLAALILAVGCAPGSPLPVESEEPIVSIGFGVTIEEGRLYFDNEADCLVFYDFALETNMPLCSVPNCKHDSDSCPAYFPARNVDKYAIYRNKLYSWMLDYSTNSLSLSESDKNGLNRSALLTVTGRVPPATATYVEGKVFYEAFNEEMDEERGLIKRTDNVACYDFEEGKEVILGSDRVSYFGGLRIMHYYDNKLYYYFNQLKGEYDESTFNPLDYEFGTDYVDTYNMVIDLQSGTEEPFDTISGSVVLEFKGKYATYGAKTATGYDIILQDLDTNETKIVASNPEEPYPAIFDSKVFTKKMTTAYETEPYMEFYDIASGNMEKVFFQFPRNQSILIMDETSDRFIASVAYYGDDNETQVGNAESVWVYKEDFYNGVWSPVLISDRGI